MPAFRSILCPVDFSDHSQHALRWAVALAARHQSRLTVLNAVDPLLAHAALTRFGLDLVSEETPPALREFVAAVLPGTAPWAPQTGIDVRVGEASEVILAAAAREQADVIVMGTHGLGGFRKVLLGSTAEHVLRRTRIPVLAVPLLESSSLALDAGGPRFNLKRILAATDFSEASTAAARWAADLAEQMAVPLVLAHFVRPAAVSPRWSRYVDALEEERLAEARARLEASLARLSSGAGAIETVVSAGRPAESIAALAGEREAGMIVLGLMSAGGPLAPRPGSIAHRVLCLAHVPVLVVPPPAALPVGPAPEV